MQTILEIILEYVFYFKKCLSRLIFGKQNTVLKSNKDQIVICIPGIFGGASLTHIYNFFKKNNKSLIILDLGYELNSIETYVDKVHQELQNIPHKHIILIGYSMGGLISLLYAHKYGWNKIDKLITIATPFKGSSICKYISFIPAAKDMTPSGPLITKVNNTYIPKNKLLCCYFKNDLLVKKDRAVIKNHESYEFKYGGHLTNSQNRNYIPFLKRYL